LFGLTGIAISGDRLFVVSATNGTVSEYTTSGDLVNPELISGLIDPLSIAVSGHNLFVLDLNNGTIGKYTTGGETVDAELIFLSNPTSIVVGPASVSEVSSAWLLLLLGLTAVLGLKSWKTA
jgi:hypothetical protein